MTLKYRSNYILDIGLVHNIGDIFRYIDGPYIYLTLVTPEGLLSEKIYSIDGSLGAIINA